MYSVGTHVPAREFSSATVSNALGHNPSARCVTVTNEKRRFLDIFGKNNVFFEGTFSLRVGIQFDYTRLI